MKKTIVLFAIIGLAFVSLRCPKQDVEADKGSITGLIESDTIWFSASTKVDSTSRAPENFWDTLIVWWRGAQTHDQPVVSIEVTGDSAWVSWSRSNFGSIYSLAYPDSGQAWVLWTKALSEKAEIRATFLREGSTGDDDRGWKLNSISLASGKSATNTVRVDSLRIKSSLYPNLLIKDPLNTYYRVDSLIAFKPGEAVTVTLYTNEPNGHAFLHTFILAWPFYIRLPFTRKTGGVYEGTWNAQLVATPRFAIFDLMPHSTLYTPSGAYDFNGWLFPYQIKQ